MLLKLVAKVFEENVNVDNVAIGSKTKDEKDYVVDIAFKVNSVADVVDFVADDDNVEASNEASNDDNVVNYGQMVETFEDYDENVEVVDM